MQKNLIHATSAMACMTNSIFSADRKGHIQDSKALIKTSLDVITILGHSHNEINTSGLNKESRQSCKKTIDNSHKLFGEDLSKNLKEMKEVKKVANEISNQRSSYAQKRGYFNQRNYDKTTSQWRNQHQQPTRGRGNNFFSAGPENKFEEKIQQLMAEVRNHPKLIVNTLPHIIEVLNFQMMSNKAGSLKSYLQKWQEFTSDPEILDTVSGMTIESDGAHKAPQPRANYCSKWDKHVLKLNYMHL